MEEKKQSKLSAFMQQMEKRLQQDCTFRPRTNPSDSQSRLSDNPLARREQLAQMQLEKFSFKPSINKSNTNTTIDINRNSLDFENAYERL